MQVLSNIYGLGSDQMTFKVDQWEVRPNLGFDQLISLFCINNNNLIRKEFGSEQFG